MLLNFLAVFIARVPRRYRGRYIRRWYRGLRSEAYQRWLPALYRLYQPGQRQEQEVKQEGSQGNHNERPFEEEEDPRCEEVCEVPGCGRPATIRPGYHRFCRACWDEEHPAPVPGDRPPPLFQPPDAPLPELSENKKAVRVKFIQEKDKIIAEENQRDENYRNLIDKSIAEEAGYAVRRRRLDEAVHAKFNQERDKVRDKIIAEKKRLDENYRLLSYFSKFVHADAARSIAKKQIGANRERIEEYEEEEASLAEEEWALMED